MKDQDRLNISQIEERTGFHRQTIWRKYKAGKFPQPHYIDGFRFWYEYQIKEWERENVKSDPGKYNLPSNVPVKNRPLPNSDREKAQLSIEC